MSNLDKQFTDNLSEGLEETLKGKSAVVFMSKLYEKDGEDRLNHRMIMAKEFKTEDIIICLEAYKGLVTDSLEVLKNNATEVLDKLKEQDLEKESKVA